MAFFTSKYRVFGGDNNVRLLRVSPCSPLGAEYCRPQEAYWYEYVTRLATVDTPWEATAHSTLGKFFLDQVLEAVDVSTLRVALLHVSKVVLHRQPVLLSHSPRVNPPGCELIFEVYFNDGASDEAPDTTETPQGPNATAPRQPHFQGRTLPKREKIQDVFAARGRYF